MRAPPSAQNAVIEETLDEAFEDLDGDGVEEDADEALQAIIDELTGQQLAGTSTAGTRNLQQQRQQQQQQQVFRPSLFSLLPFLCVPSATHTHSLSLAGGG